MRNLERNKQYENMSTKKPDVVLLQTNTVHHRLEWATAAEENQIP
jgi:hypothetical protein